MSDQKKSETKPDDLTDSSTIELTEEDLQRVAGGGIGGSVKFTTDKTT